jgi:hypothetical protein
MRLTRTLKITLFTTALAALAFVPAAQAVKSNGKNVKVKIACAGAAGSTTPGTGGSDGIYGSPYGTPYGNPYGTGPYGGANGPGTGCAGSIKLKVGKKVVAKGRFTLARGQRKGVKAKFSRKGRRLLFSKGKLKTKLVITSSAAVSAPRKLGVRLKKKKGAGAKK